MSECERKIIKKFLQDCIKEIDEERLKIICEGIDASEADAYLSWKLNKYEE